MEKPAKFQQAQFDLANIIRTGTGELENVEPRRLKIYQDLFFNNVEGFCSSAFPVFKSLMSEQSWLALVQDFFIYHQCHTPHFVEISEEFLGFLAEHKQDELPFDYMLELAHYEWIELASSIAQGAFSSHSELSNVKQQSFTLPNATFPLLYQHPVHVISKETHQDITPEQTALLVYRDEDFNVQFVLTDVLSIMAMQLLQQHESATGEQLISMLLQAAPHLSEDGITAHLQQALQHFSQLGAVHIQ